MTKLYSTGIDVFGGTPTIERNTGGREPIENVAPDDADPILKHQNHETSMDKTQRIIRAVHRTN
jgi:hypothetical protein